MWPHTLADTFQVSESSKIWRREADIENLMNSFGRLVCRSRPSGPRITIQSQDGESSADVLFYLRTIWAKLSVYSATQRGTIV